MQKNATEIKLQIGNNEAEKNTNGTLQKINLDSAPVIRNDRTLVPLRFIAESLGKTVGWDASNQTAVIIDYDYFLDRINEKYPSLYQFLNAETSNMLFSLTRNYTDLNDANNNNVANVSAIITENKDGSILHQKVDMTFSGNNELMQDIITEGWGNIQYENDYYDEYFMTKALTEELKKVYGQEQLKFKYTGLKCEGKSTDTLADVLKNMCNINENGITIDTFASRKNEFERFLSLFQTDANGKLVTGNIASDKIELNYFDLTKLDNMIFNTTFNRVFSFLNSQIFNFDVTLKELLYDYPKMNLEINVNNLELAIDFILTNNYNEKVEYVIKMNK